MVWYHTGRWLVQGPVSIQYSLIKYNNTISMFVVEDLAYIQWNTNTTLFIIKINNIGGSFFHFNNIS